VTVKNAAKVLRLNLLALMVFSVSAAILGGCAGGYVGIRTPPPPLPYYDQPICPGPGYLWVPGYWAYGSDGYFWVPGIWEVAPRVGWLWTPGYWGWSGNAYIWHGGYWGMHIGFYGGVNYGYGYGGVGYEGGYWRNGAFHYNTAVTNVNVSVVHNTYTKEVVNTTTVNRVSYNGGRGGIMAKPTSQELMAAREKHSGMTARQKQHHQAARAQRQRM
jgi:hypothetical protein